MPSEIMLSYSSDDRDFVEDLSGHLRIEGFSVLYDDIVAHSGDRVESAVADMVRRADVLIVVLSPGALDSRWLQFETTMFLARMNLSSDLRMIPLLLKPAPLPLNLSHLAAADFTDPAAHGQAKRNLSDQLRRQIPMSAAQGNSQMSPRLTSYQRGALEAIVADAVERGLRQVREEISAITQTIHRDKHLMSPDAISQLEAAVLDEVWVVTTHLYNDTHDPKFEASIRKNFERGITYTYFVESTGLITKRRALYEEMYKAVSANWQFVLLSSGVFMPFDEVVLYDPRDTGRVSGYAQMKYLLEGRQEDLFLRLPPQNVVAMAKSLEGLLSANPKEEES